MNKKIISLLCTLLCCLLVVGCGSSTKKKTDTASTKKSNPVTLTISAAASLQNAMTEIQPIFTKKYPNVTLTFSYGSSGALQQQIKQGAPSDIFISAGQAQVTALKNKGLLVDDTIKNLVNNSLVLVGPKDSKLTSLDDLKTESVTHIALGDPASVPAGKYATETLTKYGIFDSVKSKIVYGKDVKEVFSWSTTGNAEAGFVYNSDVVAQGNSCKVIASIPENLHSPIIYPIAIVKSSKNVDTAKKFEDFLFSDVSVKILKKYGYTMAK